MLLMNNLKALDLSSYSDRPDLELVELSVAGDDAAFAQIMRRHNRLLFRTARSIVKNTDDAQEVLQEAYLRAWRALSGFRIDAKLSTWLVRIVINEALGRLRRQSGRECQAVPLHVVTSSQTFTAEAQMAAERDNEPDYLLMREQLRRQLEARIDALPDAFRTVFMLRGVQEMSVEEIALALDIPQATVRTRYFRARSMLRKGLSREIDLAMSDAFSFAGRRCDRIAENVLTRIAQERSSSRS